MAQNSATIQNFIKVSMSYQEITAQQAKQMMAQNNTVLIDVRENAEHVSKHIPDSRLHPVGKISDADIDEKEHALLIYCQKGMRGKKACEKLTEQNPSLKVYNIIGGIEGWESAGFDTQSTATNMLSLDRQVQLAIGILLLVFSTLSMSVSTAFVWAVAFMGVGLCIAGATGFCGLGRLIAIMPWNKRA